MTPSRRRRRLRPLGALAGFPALAQCSRLGGDAEGGRRWARGGATIHTISRAAGPVRASPAPRRAQRGRGGRAGFHWVLPGLKCSRGHPRDARPAPAAFPGRRGAWTASPRRGRHPRSGLTAPRRRAPLCRRRGVGGAAEGQGQRREDGTSPRGPQDLLGARLDVGSEGRGGFRTETPGPGAPAGMNLPISRLPGSAKLPKRFPDPFPARSSRFPLVQLSLPASLDPAPLRTLGMPRPPLRLCP